MIGTNTMHQVADSVGAAVKIPLLHIADATAQVLKQENVERVGLLGTAFTMELDFYRDRIANGHGIEVVVPDGIEVVVPDGIEVVVPEMHDRQMVHDIIYQELCLGQIEPESREVYLAIIDRLRKQQIDGVILGCTEIGLLLQQQHTDIKLYDSTAIHARQAVTMALESN